MKKPLSYPELWQKKQRELPVKSNPDAEWLRVSAALDKRMPVTDVIKKPSRFKVPKWGLKMLVVVSSSVAVYVGVRYLSKKHQGPAKPNIQQIHRDSIVPASKDSSRMEETAKPVIGSGSPVIAPVTGVANRRFIDQTKLNNDAQKPGRQTIDSIKTPAILNVPIRRDSLLPMEAVPLKPVFDSITPVTIEKRDIQKDTSNKSKKTPKKKKRSKVSVFF